VGNYSDIHLPEIRALFDNYLTSIKLPDVDYFAIGIQDTIYKRSTSIMSRIEWQKAFKSMNLAEHDPIRKAAFSMPSNILFFDQIDYCDSLGKEVMQQREKYEISNGIVIMDRNLTYNYIMTLATNYSKFNGIDFYRKYYKELKKVMNDLKLIIDPEAKKYQFLE